MKTVKYIVTVTYDEKSPDGPISLNELRSELRHAATVQLRLDEGEPTLGRCEDKVDRSRRRPHFAAERH